MSGACSIMGGSELYELLGGDPIGELSRLWKLVSGRRIHEVNGVLQSIIPKDLEHCERFERCSELANTVYYDGRSQEATSWNREYTNVEEQKIRHLESVILLLISSLSSCTERYTIYVKWAMAKGDYNPRLYLCLLCIGVSKRMQEPTFWYERVVRHYEIILATLEHDHTPRTKDLRIEIVGCIHAIWRKITKSAHLALSLLYYSSE